MSVPVSDPLAQRLQNAASYAAAKAVALEWISLADEEAVSVVATAAAIGVLEELADRARDIRRVADSDEERMHQDVSAMEFSSAAADLRASISPNGGAA